MNPRPVIDLFAGPGGWDVGALAFDITPVGIEHDPDACSTRAAAGLLTIRADVAAYPADRTPPPVRTDRLAAVPRVLERRETRRHRRHPPHPRPRLDGSRRLVSDP